MSKTTSLYVYSMEQQDIWDGIVRSFKDYDAYWLCGYVKAFFIHGDGEPYLFYYEKDDLRAINVVMKRDIAEDKKFKGKIEQGKYYDFATPYGYGGWLIEGSGNKQLLFHEYEKWCNKHNIISEFVRFHPIIENHKNVSEEYEIVEKGECVVINTAVEEDIFANMTSTCRNRMRKAKKNGINIFWGRTPEMFETFKTIYDETMKGDKASEYYFFGERFFESVLNDLPYNTQVFYAQTESKEIISAAVMLTTNGMMNFHLGGTIKEYQHLAPVNLLFSQAAMWANRNGYRTLYLGGGVGSSNDSLLHFKKTFNRNGYRKFCIGRKIFSKDRYTQLLSLRGEMENTDYFPLYRA